jgi:hypothetical protein
MIVDPFRIAREEKYLKSLSSIFIGRKLSEDVRKLKFYFFSFYIKRRNEDVEK